MKNEFDHYFPWDTPPDERVERIAAWVSVGVFIWMVIAIFL